jgi:hypothetical protein
MNPAPSGAPGQPLLGRPAAQPDTCPRCGQAFHCGLHDAAPCACTGLQLTAAQLAALRAAYATCLCGACLRAVAAGQPVQGNASA